MLNNNINCKKKIYNILIKGFKIIIIPIRRLKEKKKIFRKLKIYFHRSRQKEEMLIFNYNNITEFNIKKKKKLFEVKSNI
jgi:hypothetical protein